MIGAITVTGTIIIPACNEEEHILNCLQSVLAQELEGSKVQVIVAANGCRDNTVDIALNCCDAFISRGWPFVVLNLEEGSKLAALNEAEAVAISSNRVFLDADVTMERELISMILQALDNERATYATGRLTLQEAESFYSRKYGGFWLRTPFVRGGTVGAGFFAVNGPGRRRWAEFPDIISDDTFCRLHFSPTERVEVDCQYFWPVVEGISNLVAVRRRQDQGVRQLYQLYPELMKNEGKARYSVRKVFKDAVQMPIGFLVYVLVLVLSKIGRRTTLWTRGR